VRSCAGSLLGLFPSKVIITELAAKGKEKGRDAGLSGEAVATVRVYGRGGAGGSGMSSIS
jgi:hypothetical protein